LTLLGVIPRQMVRVSAEKRLGFLGVPLEKKQKTVANFPPGNRAVGGRQGRKKQENGMNRRGQ